MFSEVAGVITGETASFTMMNHSIVSGSLVSCEIFLEVGDKTAFVTFKFHFVMKRLNVLFKVDFLFEFLLASLTLKLYSFMKSLLMESKMTQSGVRFSTNITGVFYLQMDSFNVSLYMFFRTFEVALFTLNFGVFMQETNVVP